MKLPSLLKYEVCRLLRTKTTKIFMILAVLAPIVGYTLYLPATDLTKTSKFIGNPSLALGLIGSVLMAVLTLYELSKDDKYKISSIVDSIISKASLYTIKTLALIVLGALITLVTMVAHLPYVMFRTHMYFLPGDYLLSYFLIALPSLIFGVLIASILYAITQRVDVSFLGFVILAGISFSGLWSENYILRWINVLVPVMSDDFSSAKVYRLAIYNRLFWVVLLGALFLFSILCMRKYEKNLLSSFRFNARRNILSLMLSVLMLVGSSFLYQYQPLIDHSSIEPVFADKKYNEIVTLSEVNAAVNFNTLLGTIEGSAEYTLNNSSTEVETVVFETTPGYSIDKITFDGADIHFMDKNNDEDNFKEIEVDIPASASGMLKIKYSGFPKEWSMLRTLLMGDEITSKYISLSNDSIYPILRAMQSDDFCATLDVTLPKSMTPVANGAAPVNIDSSKEKSNTWRLTDTTRQGFIIFAADYVREDITQSGMSINFYYSKRHKKIMEDLKAMEMIRNVLSYCSDHYAPLPFDEGLPLLLVEENAFAMGGGAFSNFSVMGETTFSEESLNDVSRGAGGSEVLAHEIVHQWWGLTWMFLDEGEWSSEGLTCYTTYRIMKDLYGQEYAKRYYIDVWQEAYDQMKNSFYYRNPQYLDILPESYRATIEASFITTKMYSEMPLKLLKAQELVGGEQAFDEILTKLFLDKDSPEFPYLTYDSFLSACNLDREELSLD